MGGTQHEPQVVEGEGEQWEYVLVPLLVLPEIDLAVSVRSRAVQHPTVQRILRTVGRSSITFVGYMFYLAAGFMMLFTRAPTGQTLAIAGSLTGLPATIVAIGNLRFDMVCVLLATYDIWFFSTVSTIVSSLLSLVFQDARGVYMVLSWISFVVNIFIDARVADLRRLWFANIISALGYIVLAVVVSVEMVDGTRTFDIIHANGHRLPAPALIRDSLVSMVVVILRNVIRIRRRAFTSTVAPTDTRGSVIRCVSFRCRLRFQPVGARATSAQSVKPNSSNLPHEHGVVISKTHLQFAPAFESINVNDTLSHVGLQWLMHPMKADHLRWKQRMFSLLAIFGFTINSIALVAGVLAPRLASETSFTLLVLAGSSFSVIFITVCLAATQRCLLRGVLTSFEFMYIGVQAAVVHFAFLDLCRWQPLMVTTVVIELLWSLWFMCWDAILPPVRLRLGLTTGLTAWIGTGLICVMSASNLTMFAVLAPNEINDRVIWSGRVAGYVLEFRPLSWYVSCSASIMTWSLRILWRLWQAAEDELVVLDGDVFYEHSHCPQTRPLNCHAVGPIDAVR